MRIRLRGAMWPIRVALLRASDLPSKSCTSTRALRGTDTSCAQGPQHVSHPALCLPCGGWKLPQRVLLLGAPAGSPAVAAPGAWLQGQGDLGRQGRSGGARPAAQAPGRRSWWARPRRPPQRQAPPARLPVPPPPAARAPSLCHSPGGWARSFTLQPGGSRAAGLGLLWQMPWRWRNKPSAMPGRPHTARAGARVRACCSCQQLGSQGRTQAKAVGQMRQVQPHGAAKVVPGQLFLAVRLVGEHGALRVLHAQHKWTRARHPPTQAPGVPPVQGGPARRSPVMDDQRVRASCRQTMPQLGRLRKAPQPHRGGAQSRQAARLG